MYFYSYGAFLSTKCVRKHCPSATFIMKAKLPNFKVEFCHYSEDDQGGVSSIIESPSQMVQGIIYEVPEREIEELDKIEITSEGVYQRDVFLVFGEDGKWHEAHLYRTTHPAGPYKPSRSYLKHMIEGAQEHNLEANYVRDLLILLRSMD